MSSTPIVVAGAGPAGATVALLLARQGRSVVLADRPRAGRAVGEHLPAQAVPLLHRLRLIGLLDGHEACAGRVAVWRGVRSERSAIMDPNGAGWLLDRRRFDAALRRAAELAGVQRVDGRVRDVTPTGDGFAVTGAWRGHAAMVVDGTGRSAHVARQLGAHVVPHSRAIAWCRWQRDAAPDRRLWVEDTDDGWFYTAPLPDQERVVVWHRERAERVSENDFDRALAGAPHVAKRCGGAWLAGPIGRPAGGQRLDAPQGEGWWAVGDAAMTFDPISSQGLLTSLTGAERAVASLTARGASGLDEWYDLAWRRYVHQLAEAGQAPVRSPAS